MVLRNISLGDAVSFFFAVSYTALRCYEFVIFVSFLFTERHFRVLLFAFQYLIK